MLPIDDAGDGEAKIDRRRWVPTMGMRIGQLAHAALAPAIVKMTARYVDAIDARAEEAAHGQISLRASDLIAGSPLELVVARALVVPHVLATVVPDRSGPRGGRVRRATLRPVHLEWEGERDRRLWTWVRADLHDATVEEVAAALYAHVPDGNGSSFAYGLAAAPPLFGLPVSWAVAFPQLLALAPEAIQHGTLPDPSTDSIAARLARLAGSSAADGLALQQAAKVDASPEQIRGAAEDVVIQLSALRSLLTPWGLAAEVLPEIGRASALQHTLRAAPTQEILVHAGVVAGQRDRLRRILSELEPTLATAGRMSPARDRQNPVFPVLQIYAQAAASSQLASGDFLIGDAERMQRGLALRVLQANNLAMQRAVDDLAHGPAVRDLEARTDGDVIDQVKRKMEHDAERVAHRNEEAKAARAIGAPMDDLTTRTRVLENQLVDGVAVDSVALERVELETQDVTMRAKMAHVIAHLDRIEEGAALAGKGLAAKVAAMASPRFSSIAELSHELRVAMAGVQKDLAHDELHPKPLHGDGDGLNPAPIDIQVKRTALSKAQARFDQLKDDNDLERFLHDAYGLIESQQMRTVWVGLAMILIGTLLTANVTSAVTGAISKSFLTAEGVAEAAELSLGARFAINAAKVATEATTNSAVQVVTTGEDPWRAIVQNTVMAVGFSATGAQIVEDMAAARAFHRELAAQVARIEGVELRAASTAARAAGAAKAIGYAAVSVTGHAVLGMALGALADQVLAFSDGHTAQGGPTSTDAMVNLASVAVGKLVHASTATAQPQLEELHRKHPTPESHEVLRRARELTLAATELTRSGRATLALDVLEQHAQLVEAHLALVESAVSRTTNAADRERLVRQREELTGNLGSARDYTIMAVRFHLIGLAELDAGTRWSGTEDQVRRAERDLAHDRPDVAIERTAEATRFVVDGHPFELHVTGGGASAAPEAAHELSTRVSRVPGSVKGHDVDQKQTALLDLARRAVQGASVPGAAKAVATSKPGTYLFELEDHTWTSIEVQIARVDGHDTARLVPNTSRQARIDNIEVRGEHILQISETVSPAEMDRVVAHGLARLIGMHGRALTGDYPGARLEVLSPDDLGRIAEVGVLAHKATHGRPAEAEHARSELIVLSEYLGLRQGAPDADVRRAAVDARLKDADVRAQLDRAMRERLTDAQRELAIHDLRTELEASVKATPPHDAPYAVANAGQRVSRAELVEYASVAQRLRSLVSDRTFAKYRALAHQHGKPPTSLT